MNFNTKVYRIIYASQKYDRKTFKKSDNDENSQFQKVENICKENGGGGAESITKKGVKIA